MTSGRKTDRIIGAFGSFLCVLALCFQHFANADSSTGFDEAELMRLLSQVREARETFTEHKYFSLLSAPLVLRGRVHYMAPDYVKKEYDDPGSESYELRADRLTIESSDGRRRDMSIDEHPVLRALVESYRATLAGDGATLRRYFHLDFSGQRDAWVLRLTPRSAELAEYLSAVVMSGQESTVYRVETLEASGDRSVMTLTSPGG